MGSDPMAVVDDRLRVLGVDRLRVIDASVMPRITSGNTNAPDLPDRRKRRPDDPENQALNCGRRPHLTPRLKENLKP